MKRMAVEARWSSLAAEWRDPMNISSQWREAARVEPALLQCKAQGAWWEVLAATRGTLLVTREYEHLVLALTADHCRPQLTYWAVPHPSGLAVDIERKLVYLASTRNPNQIYELAPVTSLIDRQDSSKAPRDDRPLVPWRSRFFPGSLYLHDLALIGGVLHASAAGHNAIVRLDDLGGYRPVWWPKSVESPVGPRFDLNYLQLNSIAASSDLSGSYFSASAATPSRRRPGHRNFPVDRRGVIFSGATREPVVSGLTRPHSARLHRGDLWVDDSGYGGLVRIRDEKPEVVARLPGWTRGLCLRDGVAFVGTSRVIPRFRHYAPGLDVDQSVCGVHAVDLATGAVLGSLLWPAGNQIFAIEWAPRSFTTGFPFRVGGRRALAEERRLFYAFHVQPGAAAIHAVSENSIEADQTIAGELPTNQSKEVDRPSAPTPQGVAYQAGQVSGVET